MTKFMKIMIGLLSVMVIITFAGIVYIGKNLENINHRIANLELNDTLRQADDEEFFMDVPDDDIFYNKHDLASVDVQSYIDQEARNKFEYKKQQGHIDEYVLEPIQVSSEPGSEAILYELAFTRKGVTKTKYYYYGVHYIEIEDNLIEIIESDSESETDLKEIIEEAMEDGYNHFKI